MTINAPQVFRFIGLAAAVVALLDVIGIQGIRIPGDAVQWAAISVAFSLAK